MADQLERLCLYHRVKLTTDAFGGAVQQGPDAIFRRRGDMGVIQAIP
jgi:hypothetical protein